MNDEDLKRICQAVLDKLASGGMPERVIKEYAQYRDVMYLMIQAGYIEGIRYSRKVLASIPPSV